jgi:CDP-glucose 4,6-dehydratase|tara:strand:- start:7554 stop:8603 length:1050 start_codon:yes stop_codon:yes gene_type:complete
MQKEISKKYSNPLYWKNKTVLITGVNGFIGGNLSKKLISLGSKVIGITRDDSKDKFLEYEKIKKKITNYKLDLKSYNSIKYITSKHNIDICFHLAAQVDVNKAKLDPFTTFESNVRGTYNLLEILRNTKSIKSIIIASSDKAYGDYPKKDLPYQENYDLRPVYPYDVSKGVADMITKSYSSDLFKLPVITTRFSNIYGPGQLNFSALIPDCILANLNYKKFIPRGNGENLRDFLYVDDVVELYLCLAYSLDKNKNLRGEVFNAGTGSGHKVKDIIWKLCDLAGNKDLYENIHGKFKNKKLIGEIEHQFMTYDKLNKYFGWKPRYSIDEGLKYTLNWYKGFLKKHDYKDF